MTIDLPRDLAQVAADDRVGVLALADWFEECGRDDMAERLRGYAL
jgi:hypothetical protein